MKDNIILNTENESIKLGNINDVQYKVPEIKDGELQIIGIPPETLPKRKLIAKIGCNPECLDKLLNIINSGEFEFTNDYGEFKYKTLSEPKVDKELHKIIVEVERV